MNRVLLDTCALIWLLGEDGESLGEEALSLIEESSVRKLLSPLSFWEIATKSTTPKYKGSEILLRDDYKEAINKLLDDYEIEVLPISLDHTEQLYTLNYFMDHKDPFDRLIVAKAIIEDAALISSDGKLYYYGFLEKDTNVWMPPGSGATGGRAGDKKEES